MQGTVKRRNYYSVGEVVWLKEDKTTGTVTALDVPNLKATVKVTKVWQGEHSGGISVSEKVVNFWDISKYKPNISRTFVRKLKPLVIKIKYLTELDEQFKPLEKISNGDWVDLRVSETITLEAGEHALIKLGVAMQLPSGYEAHIAPRGSTFKNFGILQTNTPGIVDNSYAGDNDQWMMSAYATRKTTIIRGERVAQWRLVRSMPETSFVQVETLGNTDRSGFGSTGTR